MRWSRRDADRPLRHALEFRSPAFVTPEATSLLREHDVACVLADTAGKWPKVDEDTSDFRYVRLHGDAELYASGYSDARARPVGRRPAAAGPTNRDVFVYFDNDIKGYAPHDAMALQERLGITAQGLAVTRDACAGRSPSRAPRARRRSATRSTAATASSRCWGFVTPTIGEVTTGCASSQASATWARDTPRRSATAATVSTIERSSSR